MAKKHRFTLAQITQQQLELISAYVDHPKRTIRRRAQAVSQLISGLDIMLLSRLLHISPRVLASWQARFYAQGIDGLVDTAIHQLPDELPESYRDRLDVMLKTDPMTYGYGPRDGWSIERLSDELDCETGIHIGADRLRKLLIAWGYTVGKRMIDRRSLAQKRFEAHFVRVYADHRVQLASQEHNASHGTVTITTWRAPHFKAFRRRTEAERH